MLLLTHYVMCSSFFSLFFSFIFFRTSARVLACSWRMCRRRHVRAACCVCVLLPSGLSQRWLGPAVWNSADPLKWLLSAERERGRGDPRGMCGQMSHTPLPSPPPHFKQSTASLFGVNYVEMRPDISLSFYFSLVILSGYSFHLSAPFLAGSGFPEMINKRKYFGSTQRCITVSMNYINCLNERS